MERLNEGLSQVAERSTKTRGKKRKWREIESIKDKFRLKKELEELDMAHDYALEELDF